MTNQYGAPQTLIGTYNPVTKQASLSWGASSEGVLVTYTSGTASYVVDPTADNVVVTGIGGGAGGGSGSADSTATNSGSGGGCGGGGGGYAQATFAIAGLGSSVGIVVGAGGVASVPNIITATVLTVLRSTNINTGNLGGDTTFGSILTAHGGSAATGGSTVGGAVGGTGVVVGGTAITTSTGGTGGTQDTNTISVPHPGGTSTLGGAGGAGGQSQVSLIGSGSYGAGAVNNGGSSTTGSAGVGGIFSNGSAAVGTPGTGGGAGIGIVGGGGGGGGGMASYGPTVTGAGSPTSGVGGNGGRYGGGGGGGGCATCGNATGASVGTVTASGGGAGSAGVLTTLTNWLHGTSPYYLVYRNGALIGTTLQGVTTYTDANPPIGSDTYYIVASFDGVTPMSPLSNPVTILVTSSGNLSPGVYPPLGGSKLASRAGLSSGTVLAIPDKWSKEWYRSHINNVLSFADARNAVSGPGISVTGNITQPATISLAGSSTAIANPNFGSGEVPFWGATGTNPGSQAATTLQVSPNFQFGTNMPIPYTQAGIVRGPALLLGIGGSGGTPGAAAIVAGQGLDAATAGNALSIYAGYTQPIGTSNGGQLLLSGGGSFGGTGGPLALQGGPSTSGTKGVVRIQSPTATPLIDFQSAGQIFLYSSGTAGTAGQVLTSAGATSPAVWAPGGGANVGIPATINDLLYWFQADVVTSHLNASGQIPVMPNFLPYWSGDTYIRGGTVAATKGGSLNSLGVMAMAGGERYVTPQAAVTYTSIGGPILTKATMFVVWNATNVTGSTNGYTFVGGPAGSLEFRISNTGHLGLTDNATVLISDTATETNGTWYQSNCKWNSATAAWAFRTARTAGASGTTALSVTKGSNGLLYYGTSSSFNLDFVGGIAEVIIYGRDLSLADIQTVEAYLLAKWGV